MIRRLAVFVAAGALLFAVLPASGAVVLPLDLDVQPITLSPALPDGSTLGRVRVLSVLELPSLTIERMRFSQLSGLAWDDDDGILYAISDKGWLFHLKPKFDNDKLTGVTLLKAVALEKPAGEKKHSSHLLDTEGLDIVNGRNGRKNDAELLISFERTPRVIRYRPDGHLTEELALPASLKNAELYRNANLMLESVCVDSTLGILTAPEEPLDDDAANTNRIFSLSGKAWHYHTTDQTPISAMECLGDGKVLVLERDFGHLLSANTVSLKLLTLPSTPTEDVLVPVELATFDTTKGHQIDNFEGLARYRGNKFFMISDNNDLFVQRTLLMYFEILEK